MKTLMKYLKNYKLESILAPLFKMLEASFELLVPLVIASLIDVGIGEHNQNYIIRQCLIMVLLGVIGLVCSITAQYFSAKAATGVATKIRKAMFEHIQSLSYSKIDTAGTSTLITRMTSDINQMQSGVNMFLRLFLRSPFIVIGAVVMAFYVDAKAAVVFAIAIPILTVVVFGIVFANIPIYKKVQAGLDEVTLTTRENLNGMRVIRAFLQEDEEMAMFADKNQKLTKIQLFAGRISATLNPVTYIIINVALVLLLSKGAIRVDTGAISQGDVIALVNYMSQILVELVKLANLIVTLTKAMACAGRVDAIMEIEEGMDPSEGKTIQTDSECAVCFDLVDFTYENSGADILNDISFSAKKGEIIGVIGGTGCGKTSLINLIPRFYDVKSGGVYVDGKDVRYYEVEELRKKIGVVPQKASLFKGSIRDNLLFGNKFATEEDLDEAITIACAKEFVDKKEGGLSFVIEQGGRNLSGGQKQRLTIARALVRKPEILILDDSCSALDYATDAALRSGLRGLSYHPTVFIVSQRTASIQDADQIIVLDDGQMVGLGKHEELLSNCEVYREIYESQYKEENQENKEGEVL